MLGELIGDTQSQDTGRRVLAAGDGHVTVEVSFQGTGSYYGTQVNGFGTYEAEMRADGTLYGEGQGVDMTADGQTVTWHGSGVGHMTENGGTSFRGALFFSTTSPQLERLNGTVGIFEFDTDAGGKSTGKLYEWK
ncbi:hypothetical protein F7Q99_11175 [Streptomyces kaniharaensis]|uniref:DUF3224 domain-containing protein n=1 Tax=Streptomyces kaniharaensis TaxID=212423 RepID=A0A6N7KQJ7_9ACTN|nr:hypothetical protein [Streptomyces kaniharaensis]MQS12839.1 hypothetical protein [Streptomyces kaniharaensis]